MAEQVDAYRKDKVFALQATASLWALLRIKPCKVQILASDIEITVDNLKKWHNVIDTFGWREASGMQRAYSEIRGRFDSCHANR
ncbi:hypothetical protein DRJ72_02060 [Enterococcus faecalis]|nr:hypothetical protein DRJ72_02060 [Enterococcus faecalis]RTK79146.1 hypothetical protein DRJ71_16955 [Enterococcus faecalis]